MGVIALIDEAGKALLNPTSVVSVLGAVCVVMGYALYRLWGETVRLNKIIYDVQAKASAEYQKATIDFTRETTSWRELLHKLTDALKG